MYNICPICPLKIIVYVSISILIDCLTVFLSSIIVTPTEKTTFVMFCNCNVTQKQNKLQNLGVFGWLLHIAFCVFVFGNTRHKNRD